MDSFDVTKRVTRRSVVKTGAKVAYAAPVIAASFKLSSHGALAAVCQAGFTFVDVGPNSGPATCCRCACTSFTGNLVPGADGPHCVDAFGVIDECLDCTSPTQSLPVR